MSRVLTITQVGGLAGTRRKNLGRTLKVGPVSLRFITVVIISLLTLFYLAQTQLSATKGYQIRALEEKKEKILAENERLELEATRLKSINNIQNTANELQMIPATQVNYLKEVPKNSLGAK
jgi:hypothetical protein